MHHRHNSQLKSPSPATSPTTATKPPATATRRRRNRSKIRRCKKISPFWTKPTSQLNISGMYLENEYFHPCS
ncbi:hypothetical protein QVD17_35511 [Tagetes erecta]|uniref:Uncharacterized protein n=1 Tax=Tagetes erecta TaxID=13708 RepID=A0AAD8NM28_TARER|nr:hypothetical protein QVD17_35511 [Tagetes erecta]